MLQFPVHVNRATEAPKAFPLSFYISFRAHAEHQKRGDPRTCWTFHATQTNRAQKVALKERNQSGDAFYEFANSPTPKFEADNKKQLGCRVVWHARQATNGIQESQRAHKRQEVHPENFSRHDALNRQNNEFWLVHEKTTSLLIESCQQ